MHPAVFLDRDGTMIEDVGYLDRLERLVLFPWTVDAVRLLNRAGFAVVVVTNQAGVAQGIFDESFIAETHAFLDERMRAGGAAIRGYYYCPHHPDAAVARYRVVCDCRKPLPGMVRAAERELDLDVSRSFVIGDRWRDLEAGTSCGATGMLVRTGYGRTEERHPNGRVRAAFVGDTLIDAVSWILTRRRAQP